MAKRGLKKGRWIVAGVLIAFVVVTAAVIARRSFGHRVGLEITALERKKAALASERVRLSQQIRDNSAASVIVPIAERKLGMHLPAESHMIVLKGAAESGGTP